MAIDEKTQAVERVLQALRLHGHEPKKSGTGWQSTCPAHDDSTPSLSISAGDDGKALIKCHVGCRYADVMQAIELHAGDGFDKRQEPKAKLGRIVATYDYHDASGKLLYQAVRYDPKDFRQRRPDPDKPGSYTWKLGGVPRVPYRLVALSAEHTENYVFIVEGEKDADNLAKLGFTATCNAQGAGKWHTLDTKTVVDAFKSKRVVLLPDNDSKGQSHGKDVANRLRGIAAEIRILDLPGLPEKGDVSDWLKAGGNANELRRLVDACLVHEFIPSGEDAQRGEKFSPRTNPQDSGGSEENEDDEDDPETLNTDVGNGRRFVEDHGDLVRFVPGWGFMAWDGKRWKRDEAGQAQELAKKTVARMYSEAADKMTALAGELRAIAGDETAILSGGDEEDDEQADRLKGMLRAAKKHLDWAIKSEDAKRIGAMLAMARTDVKIVATVDQFDADPFAFNVENGTIDLKTATLREHRQEDYITRLSPVAFSKDATCPNWEKFVVSTFAMDLDLICWLQKWGGYCLTGDVREQCLAILYGAGSNGKSVWIETKLDLMGDFGLKANSELLLASKSDRHPTEKAQLAGRRFVAACETGEGRRLDEVLIKEVTGGDRINAHFMRQDNFSFLPTFKFELATNHRPEIRGTDHGMWRRVKLVPFTRRFWKAGEQEGPEELKADPLLREKLKAELPGILLWFVLGAADWYVEGLGTCQAVDVATREYRDSEDVVGQFIDEQCDREASASVKASELFGAYKAWAEKQNEKTFKQTTFGRRIGEMGFEKRKSNGVVWIGLRLRHNWNSGTV